MKYPPIKTCNSRGWNNQPENAPELAHSILSIRVHPRFYYRLKPDSNNNVLPGLFHHCRPAREQAFPPRHLKPFTSAGEDSAAPFPVAGIPRPFASPQTDLWTSTWEKQSQWMLHLMLVSCSPKIFFLDGWKALRSGEWHSRKLRLCAELTTSPHSQRRTI